MKPNLYFVIPAYNEAASVSEVVRRVKSRFANVVVVDDGSSDETWEKARAAGAFVARHLINRGQGAALKTGIDYALARGADIIVTFDSDGQHQLEDVDAMIAEVLEGRCDVALGSRFLRGDSNVPLMRKLTLKLGVLFTRLFSNVKVTDTHNGLRVLSRKAAELIRIRQDRMAHASEILDEIGRLKLRYCELPMRIVYTDYSLGKRPTLVGRVPDCVGFSDRKGSEVVMLMIQVVILAFSLYVLARTFLRFRNGIIDIGEWILWSLFWIAVAVFVMVPSATQWFARLMGVGRGADAVLYVGMISISYAFYRIYLKMRDAEQQVTQLVRKLALNEAQKESKPMDSR